MIKIMVRRIQRKKKTPKITQLDATVSGDPADINFEPWPGRRTSGIVKGQVLGFGVGSAKGEGKNKPTVQERERRE